MSQPKIHLTLTQNFQVLPISFQLFDGFEPEQFAQLSVAGNVFNMIVIFGVIPIVSGRLKGQYLSDFHKIFMSFDPLPLALALINKPVNSNSGWESSLPVNVLPLPQLSASRAAWVVWTQPKQEMSSLHLNFSLKAC